MNIAILLKWNTQLSILIYKDNSCPPKVSHLTSNIWYSLHAPFNACWAHTDCNSLHKHCIFRHHRHYCYSLRCCTLLRGSPLWGSPFYLSVWPGHSLVGSIMLTEDMRLCMNEGCNKTCTFSALGWSDYSVLLEWLFCITLSAHHLVVCEGHHLLIIWCCVKNTICYHLVLCEGHYLLSFGAVWRALSAHHLVLCEEGEGAPKCFCIGERWQRQKRRPEAKQTSN